MAIRKNSKKSEGFEVKPDVKKHCWGEIKVSTDANFTSSYDRIYEVMKKQLPVIEKRDVDLSFDRDNPSHTYNYDNHVAIKKAGFPIQRVVNYFYGNNVALFAKAIGVTTRSVYNWMAGTRPSEENLSFMVVRFGLNRKYLETGEGEMFA